MTAEQIAAAAVGGDACAAMAATVRPAFTALARSVPPAEVGYVGPVSVAPSAATPGGCTVVALTLPADARFVGYRYEAADGWGSGDCVADQPCAVGDAHWLGHPTIERGARTVIWGVFVNGSAERVRRARISAYFQPAAGWHAPGS